MAKGSGFLNSVVRKIKKGKKIIKSNLATNADDQVRGSINKYRESFKNRKQTYNKNLGERLKESKPLKNILDTNMIDEQELYEGISKGIGFDDFVEANGFKNSGIKDMAEDEVSKIKGYYDNALNEFKDAGLHDEYKAIEGFDKKINPQLDKIQDSKFVGDEQAVLNKAKNQEYQRLKEDARKNNTSFDSKGTMEKLDKMDDYKVVDPYADVQKKYDDDLEALTKERDKALNKVKKTNNADEIKSVTDNYDSRMKNLNSEFDKTKDGIRKKTGYMQGTRQGALREAMGTIDYAASNASQYFTGDGIMGTTPDGKTFVADKKKLAIRAGTVGGAIMGTGVAARYLSGGNMQYNADGEKDIAGLPFV